jgi:hypothetical protein
MSATKHRGNGRNVQLGQGENQIADGDRRSDDRLNEITDGRRQQTQGNHNADGGILRDRNRLTDAQMVSRGTSFS